MSLMQQLEGWINTNPCGKVHGKTRFYTGITCDPRLFFRKFTRKTAIFRYFAPCSASTYMYNANRWKYEARPVLGLRVNHIQVHIRILDAQRTVYVKQ